MPVGFVGAQIFCAMRRWMIRRCYRPVELCSCERSVMPTGFVGAQIFCAMRRWMFQRGDRPVILGPYRGRVL